MGIKLASAVLKRIKLKWSPNSWGSLEIWGGKWDSYAKGTHPSAKFKIPPTGSDGTDLHST